MFVVVYLCVYTYIYIYITHTIYIYIYISGPHWGMGGCSRSASPPSGPSTDPRSKRVIITIVMFVCLTLISSGMIILSFCKTGLANWPADVEVESTDFIEL